MEKKIIVIFNLVTFYFIRFVFDFYKYIPFILLFFLYIYLFEIWPLYCQDDQITEYVREQSSITPTDIVDLNKNVSDGKGIGSSESLGFLIKTRRLFHWSFWERYKDKYSSYREFKESWNPKINIKEEIKKDMKDEFEGVLRTKNVISWILSRRNPSKARQYRRPMDYQAPKGPYYPRR